MSSAAKVGETSNVCGRHLKPTQSSIKKSEWVRNTKSNIKVSYITSSAIKLLIFHLFCKQLLQI